MSSCWFLGVCDESSPFLGILLTLTLGVGVCNHCNHCVLCSLCYPEAQPDDLAPSQLWLALVLLTCGGDGSLTLVCSLSLMATMMTFTGSYPTRLSVTSSSSLRVSGNFLGFFLYLLSAQRPGSVQGTQGDIHSHRPNRSLILP